MKTIKDYILESSDNIEEEIEELVNSIFYDCLEIYVTKNKWTFSELEFYYYNNEDDEKDLEMITDILDELKKSRILGLKEYKEDIQKLLNYIKSYPKIVLKYYREVFDEQVDDGFWTTVITWDS